MKNNWSDSKFADWVRGTIKPASGTLDAWNAWKKQAKQKSLRYWLAEKGLDYFQNIIYSPVTVFNFIRRYFSNRFVVKTHALTSSTLKRGQWHEFDTRLLHSNFDELVNFVETEFAHQYYSWTTQEPEKYYIPWYRKFFRLGFWRCPEAGIGYLNWASQLKNDEEWIDKNNPDYGKPTQQALAAQEVLILYRWWKTERPNRPDPYHASGWDAYYAEKNKQGDDPLDFILSDKKTEKERENDRVLFDLTAKIEKEQEDEDTEMLIRLIKVRLFLWT